MQSRTLRAVLFAAAIALPSTAGHSQDAAPHAPAPAFEAQFASYAALPPAPQPGPHAVDLDSFEPTIESELEATSLGSGTASYYGREFHGRRTANGERYDMHALTAAHKTLPFGTLVRVVSPTTGKSVVVRINDRGPYVKGRVIDLSRAAAERLGVHGHGVYKVVLYRATRGDQKAQQLALKDDDE